MHDIVLSRAFVLCFLPFVIYESYTYYIYTFIKYNFLIAMEIIFSISMPIDQEPILSSSHLGCSSMKKKILIGIVRHSYFRGWSARQSLLTSAFIFIQTELSDKILLLFIHFTVWCCMFSSFTHIFHISHMS